MKYTKSAFPVFEAKSISADYELTDPGMTLRDYFAGQALVGVIANGQYEAGKKVNENNFAQVLAKTVYNLADAMLEAREKGQSNDSF